MLFRSYNDVLANRSAEQGEQTAFRFLETGDVDGANTQWSYAALTRRSHAVGAWLQERDMTGRRALLLYPPGLEFIGGFLGCLSAAVVAVPAPLPQLRELDRALRRLGQVIADAEVDVVLTTRPVIEGLGAVIERFPELATLTWVATEEIADDAAAAWREPEVGPDSVAFLQYTSGSTSSPSGVIVTHGNLLHNQRAIAGTMDHSPELTADWPGHWFVSWLPMFHDMGLIGPVLQTLYLGVRTVLFSPLHFLQDPRRWLAAVSAFSAHTSGAPNFAYELAIRHASPEFVAGLDLSRWRVAFNGAEPIRADTLRRFTDVFAPAGLRPEALQPVYGLAEATLLVSGSAVERVPVFLAHPETKTEQVSVGVPAPGVSVAVVDPDAHVECAPGQVGEIWVAGGSVAAGYLGDERKTNEMFRARIAAGARDYLRTGDLGFLADGELFVTGRRTDLLVIDGRNHYPQDLELTVEQAHRAVRKGCVAVFSVDGADGERPVVVAEARTEDPGELRAAEADIRAAIGVEHGLSLAAVVLIQPRTIFKTSSGKIQRRACRAAYLEGGLRTIEHVAAVPTRQVRSATDSDSVRAWLARAVGDRTGVDAAAIDVRRPVAELGLGSRGLVELVAELSRHIGRELDVSVAFEHPTIADLAAAVTGGSVAAPAVARAPRDTAVAIVSMACRFPGGIAEPEALWTLLAEGRHAITEVPPDRWDAALRYDPDPAAPGKCYTTHGGFLSDIKGFDAEFFGIGAREAAAMDPQQRLLLQTSWEAIERAGVDPERLAGSRTGVYLGLFHSGYLADVRPEQLNGHVGTGSATSVASGRIAYTLGLSGPAVTVDTACSSSLVALHLGVQALRSGECDAVLTGGATLLVNANAHIEFSRLGVLSPTGRSASFAAAADGAVWSEGCAMVLLKRLEDAERDGDPILATIRGTAINQDGRSQGLSAPNGLAQEQVVRAALDAAGLEPDDVDYVEGHGTATKLGDPVEIRALARVFGPTRGSAAPVRVGSLKSNLGHTQAAAGIAGVIKTVLSLRHELLPGSVHADVPLENIDWAASGLEVSAAARPWPRSDRVRRAGVSSFGISGTNAHVIVEEAVARHDPPVPDDDLVPTARLFPVSARGVSALHGQARKLLGVVEADPELSLPALSRSLARERTHFRCRAVVLASDRAELLAGLRALAASRPTPGLITGANAAVAAERIAFVFPGQGAQWPGMASDLLAGSAVFRAEFERCDSALRAHTGWSLVDALVGAADAPSWDRDDVIQPLLFAVMVSLVAVWRDVGVRPNAVIGHSQGEIAAAYVSGSLSLQDAAAVVALRSRALADISGVGRMAVVAMAADRLEPRLARLGGMVSVAARNSGRSTVVAGDREALEILLVELEREDVFVRRLAVDYASHTGHVEPIHARLLSELAGITTAPGPIAWYSTVSGGLHADRLGAEYWYRNLREPVRFADTVEAMVADGYRYFVELSPHPSLVTAVHTIAEDTEHEVIAVGSLRRHEDAATCVQRTLAELHVGGWRLDWERLTPASGRVDLPTYAWDQRSFWIEPSSEFADAGGFGLAAADHPMMAGVLAEPDSDAVVLTGHVSAAKQPWLTDHAVGGTALFPGTGFVELAIRAGDEVGCPVVRELTLHAPLILPATGGVHLQVRVRRGDETGVRVVSIHSRSAAAGTEWSLHATGVLVAELAGESESAVSAWPPVGAVDVELDGLYERLAGQGYHYGPSFRGLRRVLRSGNEIHAEVVLPERAGAAGDYGIHPVLLDAALHALGAVGQLTDPDTGQIRVPFTWQDVVLHATAATTVRAVLTPTGADRMSIHLADTAGVPVLTVGTMVSRSLPSAAVDTGRAQDLFTVTWTPVPGTDPRPADNVIVADWTDRDRAGAVPDVVVLDISSQDEVLRPARVYETASYVLETVRPWLAEDRATTRLLVVTRGAVALPGEQLTDLAGAAAWGLLRSAQTENPDRLVLIDVDTPTVAAHVAAVALGDEPQLLLRSGQLFVARLSHEIAGGLAVPDTEPWRLAVAERGSLSGLALLDNPRAAEPLEPGQVRIAVRAAGVNFRDALICLGIYPDPAATIGGEAAGVVLEVGAGATGFSPGDRVMGVLAEGFGSVGVADERLLTPVPVGWSFAEAAGVPVVFLTAYYALRCLMDVRAGQRILIHAAAGGVGMAATQLARYWGLEVYATASPGKWRTLLGLGFDDKHIASSRSLDFEDRFLAATDGRGVDLVLHCLAGDFTDASLRLLAHGGCLVDMGKTDIRDADIVARSHPGVSYRAFDLVEAGTEEIERMLAELMTLFGAGVLRPLPVTAWDIRRAPEAFRFLSQARHTGKVVLTVPTPLDPDGTVLVTGGTGVLGAHIARHLVVEYGVGHVLLVSRRGADAAGAAELVSELTDLGARVRVVACDVADRAALAELLAGIPVRHRLTGVVHAAGVLDDVTFTALTVDHLRTVGGPKTDAAFHLHHLTRDNDLAFFVLFSSLAATFGAPGQANYAAANAYLDALAVHRHRHGLPATSLGWGLWRQASGMTGHLDTIDHARFKRAGLPPLSTEHALALFDTAIDGTEPFALATAVDIPTLRTRHATDMLAPLFRDLTGPVRRRVAHSTASDGPTETALVQRLTGLTPLQRQRILLDLVREHAADTLGRLDPETIRSDQPFQDLGFDSLIAVELRNRLAIRTGLPLPTTLLFDYPTPGKLADYLHDQLHTGTATSEDEQTRALIGTISLQDLRDSGLLDKLLVLAGQKNSGSAPVVAAEEIDDMDTDRLIALALSAESDES